ncbi:MAG: N-acetylmuramoyl-L-alanine amidase [Candidatus Pacebacteria bacterium]|nr:N-acetylmuramoyl-L-alanine amidase [Candidatus Paceibacterota bacterium]
MRHYIALAILISLFLTPWLATQFPEQAGRLAAYIENLGGQIAAVVTHNPRTIAELQKKYTVDAERGKAKIRVLLMPGHEPGYGGAEYGDLKERDLTVQLAQELSGFLGSNSKYEVIIPRDGKAWNPTFQNYFTNSWDSIIEWQKAHKEESLRRVAQFGSQDFVPKVHHNTAPSNVAYRLYGITKWSNENAVDIAIHVHFNDYPGHGWMTPGEYSGFSIYVPEAQYLNSTTTRAIAQTVFKRLAKYNAVSDHQGESGGIVDERELIAIGANNTADAASLLIEYAYIYEPQIVDPEARTLAIKDLAYQTYLGLEDFFHQGKTTVAAASYDTLMLPHTWGASFSETAASVRDVYALQTALLLDGVYPPGSRNKNDCPRTGKIGPCTREAVKAFQDKHGLGGTGIIGPKTVEKLNGLYSVKSI